MRNVLFLLVVALIMMTGCTKSSGVMEFSPKLYSVSVDVDSEIYGLGSAKKKAYEEAKSFCLSQNKVLEVESIDGLANPVGYTTATIIFRCVNK